MSRLLGMALLISLVVLIFVALVGRAIDTEVQDHILITRGGATLDCERITDVVGNVFYDSCVRVP
jgi:hypothetical protein